MSSKLNKKAIVPATGIILVAGGYYLWRKHKKNEESGKQSETNPYLAQSFIPVTAENVAGVGAVRSGFGEENQTALLDAQKENQRSIIELIEGREGRRDEREATQLAFAQAMRELTLSQTGGGAPSSSPAANVITAPPSVGSPASSNPPVNTGGTAAGPTFSCPADFPLYNPAPGKGCYRISKTMTGGGCLCHGYKDGKLECQSGKQPNCHW